MKHDIWIAGASMTPFGIHTTQSVKDLTREALTAVLADAGAEPGDLEAAVFSNVAQAPLEEQFAVRGQIALRAAGIDRIPIHNVENGCGSAGSALHVAVAMVRAEMCDVALAIGVDKLNVGSWEHQMKIMNNGLDVEDREAALRQAMAIGGYVEPTEANGHRTFMMDVYASWARGHMRDFGTTQAQFAAASAKNHQHSVHNPKSHFRKPFTVDQVLAARQLAFPITVPMCSPITDGAAAAIICSEIGLKRLKGNRSRAVRIRACALVSGSERDPRDWKKHIGHRAALKAYAEAGVGPTEISVAEVHDATVVGEIIQSECLELVPWGEGGPSAAAGITTIGGRIPINPSGGLESKGHPVGATGLGQIYELVTQLRGEANGRQVEGARLAIAENGGGIVGLEEASCTMTILSRN